MPTLYDVAHFVAWNGYAEDMLPYLGVDKAAWNNDEFWFPYAANFRHGSKKKTRLQIICEKSYIPSRRVKTLLAHRAHPDMKDSTGNSPLIASCKSTCLGINNSGKYTHWYLAKDVIDTVEILIKAGADVNHQCKEGTPMHLAAKGGHIDIVKLLLANSADVNIQNSHSEYPIHLAVEGGHIDVVKALLANSADINIVNSYNEYPIDIAAKEGNMEIIKLLIKAASVITDQTIYKAIDGNNDSILVHINKLHRASANSIGHAVSQNSTNVIQSLVKMGCDINIVENGRTLIERAVLPMFKDDKMLVELCKAGANLNITSLPNAMPPIFLALLPTYVAGVKILCKYGVDVNILYDVSHKAYHVSPIIYILRKPSHTASTDRELYEIFTALLPLADLTLEDSHGNNPMYYAKKHTLSKYEFAIEREMRKRKRN